MDSANYRSHRYQIKSIVAQRKCLLPMVSAAKEVQASRNDYLTLTGEEG